MSIPITITKLIPPRRRSDMLTRQRLLDLVDSFLDYRLIIISAPAGYGKTTLMVDYLQHTSLNAAWLSLDSLDKNPQRFLAHLAAAINRSFPLFGRLANIPLDQAALDLDAIVSAFVNDIYTHIKQDFLLVLDDFHLVSDNEIIMRFVNRFVRETDDHCRLVLVSRTLPALPDMPLLVARQQVTGLSYAELAFLPEEIQSLILQNYHQTISPETANELVKANEGWITGLVLSAQATSQGTVRQSHAAPIPGAGLYEYLIQQVLAQQEPEVQRFLLRTSFLEEFDPKLCLDVFGSDQDWGSLIEAAQANNLFIQSIGDEGHWVRYHHLFSEFLQSQFLNKHPDEARQVLKQAALAYTRRAEWEKTYLIYRRLDDLAGQLDLIEQAGSSLLGSGRLAILAEWIDLLPSEALASRPAILSLQGAVSVMQGQIDTGIARLSRVVDQLQGGAQNALLARTLARRSVGYRFMCYYKQAISDARHALELVDGLPEQDALRAEAYKSIGLSEYYNGQIAPAIDNLAAALQRFQAVEDLENVAVAHMDLGLAYMSAARYQLAFDHDHQALAYWRQTRNLHNLANLLNNLGVLHLLTGDYQQAIIHLEDALEQAVQSGYARMQAYIYCGIGDLYADLGAAHAARQAYLLAEDIANKIDYKYLLIYIGQASAELARRQGDYQLAHLLLAQIKPLVETFGSAADQAAWQLQQGLLDLVEGALQPAITALRYASWYYSESGQHIEAAMALLALAVAHYHNQEQELAWSELETMLKQTLGVSHPRKLVILAAEIGDVLHAARQAPLVAEQASLLLAEASSYQHNLPALRRRTRPYIKSVQFLPPRLAIRALGGSLLMIDGDPLIASAWQPQVRELFFRLLAEPRGLSREEIGLLLWPDKSSSGLSRSFKNVLYKLRSVLPEKIILYQNERYRFNSDQDYAYDVEAFLSYLDVANASDTFENQVAALQSAQSIYRGPYLPDLEGSWVVPERASLQNKFIRASLKLAGLLFDQSDLDGARQACQAVLGQDRAEEQAHRLLMRIHASLGNQAAIFRQYQECYQALETTLGAAPSVETRRLFEILTS